MTREMTLYPEAAEWAIMKEQARMAVSREAAGVVPTGINTPQKAILMMLKGRELDMPMMQTFDSVVIIQGKPTLTAECMLALIFKALPRTQLTYLINNDEICHVRVVKPGNQPSEFSFSYEDAKKAKLTGKSTWNTYRRAMLRSRCISEMARSLFPECLMGCSYTPEELEPAVAEPVKVLASIPTAPAKRADQEEKWGHLEQLVVAFAEHKISRYDLEKGCEGRNIEAFTDQDLANCRIWLNRLGKGEMTADSFRALTERMSIVGNREPEAMIEQSEESKT